MVAKGLAQYEYEPVVEGKPRSTASVFEGISWRWGIAAVLLLVLGYREWSWYHHLHHSTVHRSTSVTKPKDDAGLDSESDSLDDVLGRLEKGGKASKKKPDTLDKIHSLYQRHHQEGREQEHKKHREAEKDKAMAKLKEMLSDSTDTDLMKALERLDGGEADEKDMDALQVKLKEVLSKDTPAKEDEVEEDAEAKEQRKLHQDFAKQLHEHASEKPDYKLKRVKKEFKKQFGADSKPVLCSTCKKIAGRLSEELTVHKVNDQENPNLMLEQVRKALVQTCIDMAHEPADVHHPVPKEEVQEHGPMMETPSVRLCRSLLEDARFDLLETLIRRKVPSMHRHGLGTAGNNNWERWLCAHRAKVCKRSEVKDDDDDYDEEEKEEL